ncbi:hypothetical protein GCM10009527_098250 [Actinomadura nitritigenes]|jgi:hypothetical protein|uniref:Uncharacterized protein n=1 Tax=Actinomadura nitritigenes TaxID=134602 RepID=A0ABS3QWB7_9ACTN|nr:hypothetical protein [Actinomadura nitritigenes]MBO2438270.1 hypothetical protein [Actinomadura nitritigenes]
MSEDTAQNVQDERDERDEAPARPERAPGEVDMAALQSAKREASEPLETARDVPVWERDDAPAGSTASSLMVYERGKAVRVSGPTHYAHLANGRVVAGYSGGTHHTEPGENGGPDKISRIVAIHEG